MNLGYNTACYLCNRCFIPFFSHLLFKILRTTINTVRTLYNRMLAIHFLPPNFSPEDNKKRACLLHPCSLMRPTKAFRENTNAKDTPGTCMCHIARPSQDMSFPDKFWSFHQNEQVRVVTRSFYLYHCA